MKKIPVYQALIKDDMSGISTISFVTNPATMIDLICFEEQQRPEQFKFADDEKHMVTSVVMLADTNIYRYDDGYEYYIQYSKDTLLKMCEKMLKDNTFNNISFEHDGKQIEPGLINLVELYTTDANKKSPFNIPEGSIVATYKIEDDGLWNEFKSGRFGGISLEGYFNIEEVKQKFNTNMSNLNKLIMRALLKFGVVTTDQGDVYFTGETLAVGEQVYLEDGTPAPDGEYIVDDTHKFVVKDGVVDSMEGYEDEPDEPKEPVESNEPVEATEEPTEEATEEPVETTEPDEPKESVEDLKQRISELEAENEQLKAENEELKAKVAELEEKLKETPEELSEQFEKQNQPEKKKGYKYAGLYK